MTTNRKNLTPKHVMLKHDTLGEIPALAPHEGRKWAPLSPGWLRTLVLGYHSPTWATALALSTMLVSEDLARRDSLTMPGWNADTSKPAGRPKPYRT
jgi:hypothetical protein